jgi:DNA gyrase subunit B
VQVHFDDSVSVEDNGRGIPVGEHPTEKRPTAEIVMTVLHAGRKVQPLELQGFGWLHGVGVSVVNALSEWLKLEIKRDGKVYHQEYRRGDPAKLEEIGVSEKSGTKITFKPDGAIFKGTTEFSFEVLSQRLRELSLPEPWPDHHLEDERSGKAHEFKFAGGLAQFVADLNTTRVVTHEKPIVVEGEQDGTVKSRSRCSGTTRTRTRSSASPTTSRTRTAART